MNGIKIKIYTDGACSGNPGPGGWAAILLIKTAITKQKIKLKGGITHTTNNRMEMLAVIKALKFIDDNIDLSKYSRKAIEINSDSSYVVSSINNGSINKWAQNGWKTTRDTDVVNKDLWERLIALKTNNTVFNKVKGHSGNKYNEYVDKMAVEECNKYKQIAKVL